MAIAKNKLYQALVGVGGLGVAFVALTGQAETQAQIQPPPLPVLHEVRDDSIPTIDSLFMAMAVTRPMPINPAAQADAGYHVDLSRQLTAGAGQGLTVYPDINLVDFETGVLNQFIRGQGAFAADPEPADHRAVIVMRYGLDNPKAVQALLDAKKMGLHSLILVTDGPITLDGSKAKFGTQIINGEERPANYSNDMHPDMLLATPQGQSVRQVLEGGYEFASPVYNAQPANGPDQIQPRGKFMVTTSAMIQGMKITPIMHEKEMIMAVLKDPAQPLAPSNIKSLYVMHGSGNWSVNPHFNRTFLYRDSLQAENGIGRQALAHAQAAIADFSQAGRTARIPDIEPLGMLRLTARDGSFLEQAYTDGRFELNTRIIHFLQEVAAHPESYKIDEVVLGHFVFTNRGVAEALSSAWTAMSRAGRPFKIRGMLDEQYAELEDYGLSASLGGFDIRNDSGRVFHKMSDGFVKSVHVFVNFAEMPGAHNIDPDGAPEHRRLEHDKTTWIKWQALDPQTGRASGSAMVDLWTGSYNNSTNKNNLERQDYIRVSASSPLARAIHTSIMTYVKQSVDERVAFSLRGKAVPMTALSRFLAQSPLDLEPRAVDDFVRWTRAGDLSAKGLQRLSQILTRAAPRPSRFKPELQVTPQILQQRLTKLARLAEWYSSHLRFIAPGKNLRPRPSDMMHLMLMSGASEEKATMILNGYLFFKEADPAKVAEQAKLVYEFVKGAGPLPPERSLLAEHAAPVTSIPREQEPASQDGASSQAQCDALAKGA